MEMFLNKAHLSVLIVALSCWGCVSSTKTGKEPVQDATQTVDVAIDIGFDDVTVDTEPQPDTGPPTDTSPVPVDTHVAPTVDTEPPTWPEEAKLEASKVTTDSLTLAWPMASDDTFVTTYKVYRDGLLEKTLPSAKSKTKITELDEAETVSLSVFALDDSGNISKALTLSVQTGDETAPSWPEAMSLIATQMWDTGVFLSWTPASDNVQVVEYRIMDGETVVRTIVSSTQGDVSTLTPWTETTLSVVAVDSVGNISVPGPSLTFKTPDTQAPVWTEESALTFEALDTTSIKVGWKHDTTDAGGLASYTVFQDKVVVGTLNALNTVGENAQFIVKELKAAGTYVYTVQATDEAGNMSTNGPTATVNMQDQTAPTWPEGADLLASNVTPNTLTLAWTPANDDVSVTAYHVHQDGEEVAVVATTHTAIQSLGPWTDYTFTVWAKDGAGNLSKQGPSLSLKTPDSSPPVWQKGAALTASDVTPDSLTLNWQAATDDVTVVHHHVFQNGVKVGTLDGQAMTFDVTGLSPWTDYNFSLKAEDQAGNMSEADLELTVKTTDEMAPSWNVGGLIASDITPESLTLSWPKIIDDGAVSKIVVQMDGDTLAELSGDIESLEVTELSPWVEYEFGVSGEDEAGNVSDSLTLKVQTSDNVAPSWPDDPQLSIHNVKAQSLELNWPEAGDDVAVSHYVVTVDGDNPLTVEVGLTSATLTELTPSATYLFSVVAVDAAGNVSLALNITETMPNSAPTWPGGELIATDVSGFSIKLSWPPATDDIEVVGYRLYRDGELIAEQQGTEAVIDGLSHSTVYEFKVEAGDNLGIWSIDGPSLTVSTAKFDDPGFKRFTREQFARTATALMGQFFDMYCGDGKTLIHWGCKTMANGGQSLSWYGHLMTSHYGIWTDFRRLYPHDLIEPAKDELRGGYRRFDQVVHPGHVHSWIYATMMIAKSYFEDDTWDASTGEPAEWGDMGWGDRMVFKPCEKAYKNDPDLFENEAQMYETCVSDFIMAFAPKAYRQPVTDEEHAHLLGVYQAVDGQYDPSDFTVHGPAAYSPGTPSPAFNRASRGLRNVMAVILASPKFLYRVELGDENGNLTAYELASRLSYHFWNSMPDDELFAAAADGSLMTEEGYQAQVERLAASEKADRAITEFYQDYFRVEDIPDIQYQDSQFADRRYTLGVSDSFGQHPLGAGKSYHGTRGIGTASRKELTNLGMWFTRTQPGTYADMFTSNLNFLECGEIYKGQCTTGGADLWGEYIYGVKAWDGESEPIPLPEAERAGLLTRIGMLAHQSNNARPIRRGLKIQEMLLCRHIPPPQNCDVVKPPVLTGLCEDADGLTGVSCSDDKLCGPGEICVGWDKEVTMTVRDKVEEITQSPGTSCSGCHSTFINGFGHALGHFSSEGKYWGQEHMFSNEKAWDGTFAYEMAPPENWPTPDTTGSAIVKGQMLTVNGAKDLSAKLLETGQLEWCWSREYFRFAMGRTETDVDGELIETLADTMKEGATLADAFKAIAYLAPFKTLSKPIPPQDGEDTP
jgi:chitodextrinase